MKNTIMERPELFRGGAFQPSILPNADLTMLDTHNYLKLNII